MYVLRRYSRILSLIVVGIGLQLAFLNCIEIGNQGFQSGRPGYFKPTGGGNGNGNGYVGIDAPMEVRAGTSFIASAYGGVGEYRFQITKGQASYVPIANGVIEVQVAIESENSLLIEVEDEIGKIGFAEVVVLPSDPQAFQTSVPTGSSIESMYASPDGSLVFKHNGDSSILTASDSGEELLNFKEILGVEIYDDLVFNRFSEDSQWLVFTTKAKYNFGLTDYLPQKAYIVKRDGSKVFDPISSESVECTEFGLGTNASPFVSFDFDKQRLIYSCKSPKTALFSINFDGSSNIQISSEAFPVSVQNHSGTYYFVGNIQPSPNGKYLFYSGVFDESLRMELRVWNYETNEIQKIETSARPKDTISNVKWAPDSSYIVYGLVDAELEVPLTLNKLDIDSFKVTKINNTVIKKMSTHYITFEYLEITPDSNYILYTMRREGDAFNRLHLFSNNRNGDREVMLSREDYGIFRSYAFAKMALIFKNERVSFFEPLPSMGSNTNLVSNHIAGDNFITLKAYSPRGYRDFNHDFQLNPVNGDIIYQNDHKILGQHRLYKVNINGGAVTQLTPNAMPEFSSVKKFIISPDGSKVIYTADMNLDEQFEIYSTSSEGGPSVKLSPEFNDPMGDAYDVNWVLSPDSQYILFQADAIYNSRYDYYRAKLDGSELLLTSPQFKVAQEKILSWPGVWGHFVDSENYVFMSVGHDFYGASYHPYVFNTQSRLRHRLSEGQDQNIFTSHLRIHTLSKINKFLFYDEYPFGSQNLWLTNKDGSGLVNLFNPSKYSASRPVYTCMKVSDDEQHVVFAGETQSGFVHDLHVVNTDGSGTTQLTTEFSSSSFTGVVDSVLDCKDYFAIAPDSSRVVYIADHELGKRELWSVNLDGTDKKRISQDINLPESGSFRRDDLSIRKVIGFSKDSKWVYFYGSPSVKDENHIYSVSPNGGTIHQITDIPNTAIIWSQFYTPVNSDKLVALDSERGKLELVVMDALGKNKKVISGDLTSGHVRNVKMIDNAGVFVYEANQMPLGQSAVYRVGIDGKEPVLLTGDQDVAEYDFSEDFQSMLYLQKESNAATSWTIWEVGVQSLIRRKLELDLPQGFAFHAIKYVPGSNKRRATIIAKSPPDESDKRIFQTYLYDLTTGQNKMIWDSGYNSFSNQPAYYNDGYAITTDYSVQFVRFPF